MNKMIRKTLLITALFASATAYADENKVLNIPQEPVSFDKPVALPSEQWPSENQSQALPQWHELIEGDEPEQQINKALLTKDWPKLAGLLAEYATQPQYDETLYRYALGALRREQFRHGEAVALYREIMAEAPDLVYPRFDLGVMLFEDKQYREAEQHLQKVQSDLPPAMSELAKQYAQAAKKVQSWQPVFNLNYEQTDNVNNASSARQVEWEGKTWHKTEDSLPKSAHGIRHALGVERNLNLTGNHFFRFGVMGSGVHYWDAQDYSEQTVRISSGYRRQNSRQEWGVTPYVEQNWLDDSRYVSNTGVTLDYNRRLNEQWRMSQYAQFSKKRYQDGNIAERYNSRVTAVGATLSYRISPTALIFGGVNGINDDTKEREQASWRYGVNLGGVKQFENGIGLRANASYIRREFKAPAELVYRFTRRDHEYQTGVALWHRKISWRGFTPQLNFRYINIDSNMPAFYSRNSKEWFMSVEKTF